MIIKEFSKIDNKWHIIVKEKEKATDNISVIKKQYTFPDDIQKEINKILAIKNDIVISHDVSIRGIEDVNSLADFIINLENEYQERLKDIKNNL